MIDVWPAQDALANITVQSEGNGGGAYNVTKNLAKLGCGFPLSGVGLIGRDADGEAILRDCEDNCIEHSAIEQTMLAPTSYTDVMTVSSTGRRTFFHQHGANALLDGAHFHLIKSTARIFYLGYLCLLKKRYADSARFSRDAFTAEPKLAEAVPSGVRYNAACSASLGGCGKGEQERWLPESERSGWRGVMAVPTHS